MSLAHLSIRRTTTNGPTTVDKMFAGGDRYVGQWRDGLPEGEGKYLWADQSTYEGGWKDGKKDGLGTYWWPTGASYKGEWSDGSMHGVGTFESPDGTRYQGGWARDLKQGLGKKWFPNGDTYEATCATDGLWKGGKPDGPGRYKWRNKNDYDGEWRAGRMHGQGTLRWASGERYDGEWVEGEEDGLGVFTWRDGTTYDGFWQSGKKHGIGVYRTAQPDAKRQASASALPGEPVQQPQVADNSESPVSVPSLAGPASADHQNPKPMQESGRTTSTGRGERGDSVFIREYSSNKLLREDAISAEELDAVFGPFERRQERRQKRRIRTKRWEQRPGETIYKGHRSYDLMLNLQLGIRWSVSRSARDPALKELPSSVFSEKVKQLFPRDGSKATPPHPSADFKWKDYCPMAFRQLRKVFNIDAGDYMLSVCGDQALRELPSPGKSGSVFFLSHDDRFIIKTMRKNEVKLLLELLPKYHAHVERYPHTLLIKFYGLHRVVPLNGSKVRFIVMNNLFQTDLHVQRKYDLKGSTQGRFSGKAPTPNTILKDLDLDISLKLEEGWHERLMKQLAADCALMEELRVMDYSLLLGVHYRSPGYASSPQVTDKAVASCIWRPAAFAHGGTDELTHHLGHTRVHLGLNMAATAVPIASEEAGDNAHTSSEDVVLYFGIIDILQEYNMSKRFEHGFKSLSHDGSTISAVNPRAYANRFQDFMKK
ncbi:MAG: phosphatidylinositol-4-phosphate 5-kinase, partial [Trebouxia sp. A1-2]